MKITKELRSASREERLVKLEESRKELLKLRTKAAGGGNVANPGKIRQMRKSIARILTLNNQK